MPFVAVARCSAIPEGVARTFDLGGTEIAVFHSAGGFHACRNLCPHRGGPIGEGDFDGRIVTCPWHGWQFDVATGVNVLMPAAKLEGFRLEIDGDEIRVDIP